MPGNGQGTRNRNSSARDSKRKPRSPLGGQEYEQLFTALFELSNDAMFLIGPDGCHIAANKRGASLLGYDPEELIGLPAQKCILPAESTPAQKRFEALFAGEAFSVYERTMITREGRPIPVEISATLVRDSDGEPIYIQSVVRDISKRKKEEERQRLLVEGVSAVTGENFFRTLVRRFGAALGVEHAFVAECTDRSATRVRTLAFWSGGRFARNFEYDVANTPCEAVLKGEACVHSTRVQELFPRDRDLGELNAVGYLGLPLVDSRNGDIVGHLVAIDEKPLYSDVHDEWLLNIFASRAGAEVSRRRIEEQLLQARKMETMSLLAGGIAHDFNNLLMGILGNLSLARGLTDPNNRQAHLLGEAEKAVDRAKRLTQQLLTLSKGGAPLRKATDIEALIRESVELTLSGSSVSADYRIADDLWAADADPGQIGQVMENLTINAVQAMPGGGLIRITADNVTLSEDSGSAPTPGKYVRVQVRDDGIGIPLEHQSRIFDPYFTTKDRGSGLGLTTCYAIVNKHEGLLGVESAPDRGATFTIHLPAHEERPPHGAEPETVPRDGKRRRILLMDDEEMVRSVVGEMLTHAGYDVSLAANGEQAIEDYGRALDAGEPFGAVLLDLTVRGGMGGKDAMRHLLDLDPQVRGVVCSGYSDDPVMAEFEDHGFLARIAKPFVEHTLAETLESVLPDMGSD